MASDVINLKSAPSVEGQSIAIRTDNGVMVDDAKVIKTDIVASNGVIHVIDTVIMPNWSVPKIIPRAVSCDAALFC